jgi:hypothetical protein
MICRGFKFSVDGIGDGFYNMHVIRQIRRHVKDLGVLMGRLSYY